jgi:hypothetical protein
VSAPNSATERGASLVIFMDELLALERSGGDSLIVKRWKPAVVPATPFLYHTLVASPFTVVDPSRSKDTLNIGVRVVVKHGSEEQEMREVERWIDRLRDLLDPALNPRRGDPLNGAAAKASRTSLGPATDEFDGIPYIGLELLVQAELHRHIVPA